MSLSKHVQKPKLCYCPEIKLCDFQAMSNACTMQFESGLDPFFLTFFTASDAACEKVYNRIQVYIGKATVHVVSSYCNTCNVISVGKNIRMTMQ